MRILLLCSSDLNACLNLNALLPTLTRSHVVSVLQSNLELPEERGNSYADQKIWYEKDFILRLFDRIDASSAGDPGRGGMRYLTFRGLAGRFRIPFITTTPHTARTLLREHTDAFRPDVIFCCRFDHIVHREIFERPGLSAFNLHSGPLPSFAGPEATFWTMLTRQRDSGCTIHDITPEIDGGAIVASAAFTLDYDRSVLWNRIRAYEHGIRLFLYMVRRLDQGEILPRTPQNRALRTYYPFPTVREFTAFAGTGGKLVDPGNYARLVRGFLPRGMELPDCTPACDPGRG